MEENLDEEDMKDVKLDDDRERHWRIFFEDNDGGVDDKKSWIHDNRWDVYMNEKKRLIKGGYWVYGVDSGGKKLILEVVDNHVVEEGNDHDKIVLRGFGFNLFGKDEKGVGIEGSSEFPYSLMLIKLRPGYWKTCLNRMHLKVYDDNGKSMGIGKVRYRNFCRFSINGFWKNIGCLVSAPTFGLGGSSLCDK